METNGIFKRKLGGEFGVMSLLLLGVLAVLFYGVFIPDQTLFSNDGPLGRIISDSHKLPERFTGCWADLNGIGFSSGAAAPGLSLGLQYLLKPVWFSKLYAFLSLIILGLGAWSYFTQLRLSRTACLLGGLAAALNSCFFSVACWGVAAQAITPGMVFFALAALSDTTSRLRWWRVALGGLAVGLAVIDGSDVGAIYSLYVVIFLLYQAWVGEGAPAKKMAIGVGRVALVAVCAGLIAAQTVDSLVGTSIVGVAGTQQDTQTKDAHWDWATQWSMPLEETTALVVPGLFGYRMDAPNGACYWGRVGQDPAVQRFLDNGRRGSAPHGFMRYAGGGYYAGVLVITLAVWALVQSLRRKNSVFSLPQRKWIWFWFVIAFVSILFCYGRFAPFYQLLYALPYFSTIRNPIKFIYLVSIAILVIFTYGVDGLVRQYLQPAVPPDPALRRPKLKVTMVPARAFEKNWMTGCWVVLAFSLVAWLVYGSEHQVIVDYLHSVQFHDPMADQIATFSFWQVSWFLVFFVLTIVLIGRFFAGTFAGPRAKWGGIALAVLLFVDLGRANLPWVIYWNYAEKYATNPVIETLREKPYEHRVTAVSGQAPPNLPSLDRLYRLEWLQQQFPYYNIQTLDVVDMPRKPRDLVAYSAALGPTTGGVDYHSLARVWQLTNSRYILGVVAARDTINAGIGRPDMQLQIAQRFDIVPAPGLSDTPAISRMTAKTDDNGAFALFEFTGALPRAKLYANWEVITNDPSDLERLASPSFEPTRTVLVSDELPAGAVTGGTNQDAGTVDFASYAPKDIVLKCNAPSAGVLLLNDHFDADWKVSVDGQPEKLLRCNYIMRGALVPAGAHTVEFHYRPPYQLLYLTLAVMAIAALLLMGVLFCSRESSSPTSSGKTA